MRRIVDGGFWFEEEILTARIMDSSFSVGGESVKLGNYLVEIIG
jgi:hypothetical protein